MTSFAADFTEQEIKAAMFDLPHNKVHGPDRFSIEFYQTFWEDIKEDIISATKYFSIHSRLPTDWSLASVVFKGSG